MDVIDARIRSAVQAEGGRVTLARFMELALTAPDAGYYVRDHRILGEGGDFTTVPREVPAFNRSLALFMAELIDTMGQDSRLTVVEVGAGEGDMAQGVLGSWEEDRPELKDIIRYRLVDVGGGLVRRQRERLKPFTEAGWDVAWWSSLDPNESEIAGDGGGAIVVSKEFLDALPTHLLRVSGWQARRRISGRVVRRWLTGGVFARTATISPTGTYSPMRARGISRLTWISGRCTCTVRRSALSRCSMLPWLLSWKARV